MFSVFLLSLALSVDAFAVAFSYGLSLKKDRFFSSLQIGLSTSIGQFIMPILGWLATDSIHQYIKVFDHWIAFFVFGIKHDKERLWQRQSTNKSRRYII